MAGALGQYALGQTDTPSAPSPAVIYPVFSSSTIRAPKRILSAAIIGTTFIGFVAPPQPAKANIFSQFSPALKRLNKALYIGWLSTPVQFSFPVPQFTKFSQPEKSRYTIFDESQSVFYPPAEPPKPPFTGFSSFEGIIKARLNVARFSDSNFIPFIVEPIDTHDGVFVKRKRKRHSEDRRYKDEAEVRFKRRAAIFDAIHGPELEYTLPPFILPPQPPQFPNLGNLPSAILAAQQQQIADMKVREAQEDEDDLENILKDIL